MIVPVPARAFDTAGSKGLHALVEGVLQSSRSEQQSQKAIVWRVKSPEVRPADLMLDAPSWSSRQIPRISRRANPGAGPPAQARLLLPRAAEQPAVERT